MMKHVISILEKVEQCTRMGTWLSKKCDKQITKVLQANANLFAWTTFDMLGTDPKFHFQRILIFPDARLTAQKEEKVGGRKKKGSDRGNCKLD